MISIKVSGHNRVANGFRKIVSQNIAAFDDEIGDHVKGVRKEARNTKYPPKLPNQVYVRTGKLAVSFSARRVRPGVWTINNSRNGSQFVIDENHQAGIHQGRWYTLQAIERKRRPQLTRALTEKVKSYVS